MRASVTIEENATGQPCCDPSAYGCSQELRVPAKERLRAFINRLRERADYLEALCKSLPEELPEEADLGLMDLVHCGQKC